MWPKMRFQVQRGTEAADDHLHHRCKIHYMAEMFNPLTIKIRMEYFPSNHLCLNKYLPDLRCILAASQLEIHLLQEQHIVRLISPHLSHLCTSLFLLYHVFCHTTSLCCIFNGNMLLDLQRYALNP